MFVTPQILRFIKQNSHVMILTKYNNIFIIISYTLTLNLYDGKIFI